MKKRTSALPAASSKTKSKKSSKKEIKMAKIVVDVMLKPEILDPQGVAVSAALPRLGFNFAKSVRQGKRFEIEVDGEPTPAQLAEVEKAAETLLANPVIETFTIRVEK
jgi:phosphoribosylformylglycinamidine synthase